MFLGTLFFAAIVWGIWISIRNLRDAWRGPDCGRPPARPLGRPEIKAVLLGALIGWWLSGN